MRKLICPVFASAPGFLSLNSSVAAHGLRADADDLESLEHRGRDRRGRALAGTHHRDEHVHHAAGVDDAGHAVVVLERDGDGALALGDGGGEVNFLVGREAGLSERLALCHRACHTLPTTCTELVRAPGARLRASPS
jgi:hypothetical protein